MQIKMPAVTGERLFLILLITAGDTSKARLSDASLFRLNRAIRQSSNLLGSKVQSTALPMLGSSILILSFVFVVD